jgi:hypothetical protein
MLAALLMLAACGETAPDRADDTAGEVSGDTGDDAGVSGADTADPCDGAPMVGWDSFADGFFASYCRSCHSETAEQRYGAPEGIDFDTEEQAAALAGAVRQAVLADGTMPIGGGVLDEDKVLLEVWLDCGL